MNLIAECDVKAIPANIFYFRILIFFFLVGLLYEAPNYDTHFLLNTIFIEKKKNH